MLLTSGRCDSKEVPGSRDLEVLEDSVVLMKLESHSTAFLGDSPLSQALGSHLHIHMNNSAKIRKKRISPRTSLMGTGGAL